MCGLFVLNNLAVYLGLTYFGPMTMYSGLTREGENHLLMPKIPLTEANAYVAVVRVDAERDSGVPGVQLFRRLQTRVGDRRPLIHFNVVRYQVGQACAASPGGRLALTLQTSAGRRLDVEDACAEPALRRYDLLTSYSVCKERLCRRAFAEWLEAVRPER